MPDAWLDSAKAHSARSPHQCQEKGTGAWRGQWRPLRLGSTEILEVRPDVQASLGCRPPDNLMQLAEIPPRATRTRRGPRFCMHTYREARAATEGVPAASKAGGGGGRPSTGPASSRTRTGRPPPRHHWRPRAALAGWLCLVNVATGATLSTSPRQSAEAGGSAVELGSLGSRDRQ